MIDLKMERPRMSLDQLKPVLPVVALVCALLAAWLGWSAWQQYRDASRHGSIEQARDASVEAIEASASPSSLPNRRYAPRSRPVSSIVPARC